MTGVVLCGGISSRMGADKGLLLHNNISWAQLATNKIEALQLPVRVSVNAQQYDVYQEFFPASSLCVDDDRLSIGGPLKGILSVHYRLPDEDLLVLACDMRDMQTDVIEYLQATASRNRSETVVFGTKEKAEPLCGIYSSAGLKKIAARYEQGRLEKHSLHHVLNLLNVAYLPIKDEWKTSFNNYNSPNDLFGF